MTEYWKMNCPKCGIVDSLIPKTRPKPEGIMHMTCHTIGSFITEEPKRVEYATKETTERPAYSKPDFKPAEDTDSPAVDEPRKVLSGKRRT